MHLFVLILVMELLHVYNIHAQANNNLTVLIFNICDTILLRAPLLGSDASRKRRNTEQLRGTLWMLKDVF